MPVSANTKTDIADITVIKEVIAACLFPISDGIKLNAKPNATNGITIAVSIISGFAKSAALDAFVTLDNSDNAATNGTIAYIAADIAPT